MRNISLCTTLPGDLARIEAPPKAFQNKGLFASCFGMEREDAEGRKAGSDKPMENL